MATKPQAAFDRLGAANGNAYDPTGNPGGLAQGGHRQNFVPDLKAVADVGIYAGALADELAGAAASALSSKNAAKQSETAAATSAAAAATFEPALYARLTGATFTGTVAIAQANVGRVALKEGDAANPGYVEFRDKGNARWGYVGFGDGQSVYLRTENGHGLKVIADGGLDLTATTPAIFRTAFGYGSFGSANASFLHIGTDRPAVHVNKPLRVQGDIKAGDNYDQTVWHSGNDGSGSELNADLLDGFHASIASNANMVAVRDAAGDITGRLFRTEYPADSAAINYVLGMVAVGVGGVDNYARPRSLAAFRSDLSVYSKAETDTKDAARVAKTGDSMVGNLQISKSYPSCGLSWDGVRFWNIQVDADGHLRLVDQSAATQTHKFFTNGNIYAANYGYASNWWDAYQHGLREFRKVSAGSSGTVTNFTAPAGAVITGYLREGGNTGQVASLYYKYLQAYSLDRGWFTINEE